MGTFYPMAVRLATPPPAISNGAIFASPAKKLKNKRLILRPSDINKQMTDVSDMELGRQHHRLDYVSTETGTAPFLAGLTVE